MDDDSAVSRFDDLNAQFDEMWTRAFANFRAVPLALVACIAICVSGAGLLLAGVDAIYPPAALILAGVALLYLAFVLSTRIEGP